MERDLRPNVMMEIPRMVMDALKIVKFNRVGNA